MSTENEQTTKTARDSRQVQHSVMPELPPVLDVCCGSRMMWFNKADSRSFYVDKRKETHEIKPSKSHPSGGKIIINPDKIANFTMLPFEDNTFWHIVFDPPHLSRLGDSGILAKKYGKLFGDWESDLQEGFRECFRVLKPNGTLIFKWSSVEVPLSKVISLSPIPPLYGHNTGKRAKTHWIAFIKPA